MQETGKVRVHPFETDTCNIPSHTAQVLLKDLESKPAIEADRLPEIDRHQGTLRRGNGHLLKSYAVQIDTKTTLVIWFDRRDKVYFLEKIFQDGSFTCWFGPYKVGEKFDLETGTEIQF